MVCLLLTHFGDRRCVTGHAIQLAVRSSSRRRGRNCCCRCVRGATGGVSLLRLGVLCFSRALASRHPVVVLHLPQAKSRNDEQDKQGQRIRRRRLFLRLRRFAGGRWRLQHDARGAGAVRQQQQHETAVRGEGPLRQASLLARARSRPPRGDRGPPAGGVTEALQRVSRAHAACASHASRRDAATSRRTHRESARRVVAVMRAAQKKGVAAEVLCWRGRRRFLEPPGAQLRSTLQRSRDGAKE